MLKRVISSCVVAISIVVLLPSMALAETTVSNVAKLVSVQCECWCGLEGRGAKPQGTETSQDACYINCTDRGEKFLACSKAGDQSSPHTNLRCWDKEQCIKSRGRLSDKTPAECMPSFVYCYPVDKPIKLSLSMNGVNEVLGIGGYIKVVYQWLLGVAAVFAIIMIIIGGIKYMVAGGSPNGVKEAKKDIFNALIGVVILLCTYLILATVNPQLLSLRMPSLPMVRPVETPGASNACESYENAKYTVGALNKNCGSLGTLRKGPSGETLSGNEECTYRNCPEPAGAAVNSNTLECLVNTEDSSLSGCKPCEEFTNDEGMYPKASDSLCGSFRYTTMGSTHTRCIYFPEKRTTLSALTEVLDKQYGFCGKIEVNCPWITSCGDYGGIKPKYASDQSFGYSLDEVANTNDGLLTHLFSSALMGPVGPLISSSTWFSLRSSIAQTISNPDPLRKVCEMDLCSLNCKFVDHGKSILTGNNYACVSK